LFFWTHADTFSLSVLPHETRYSLLRLFLPLALGDTFAASHPHLRLRGQQLHQRRQQPLLSNAACPKKQTAAPQMPLRLAAVLLAVALVQMAGAAKFLFAG
jgi:hypothetical protein